MEIKAQMLGRTAVGQALHWPPIPGRGGREAEGTRLLSQLKVYTESL